MAKYYCLLCETSHPTLKPSMTCPSCGRIFCLESINQSFSVGMVGCPYCDYPLKEFNKSDQIPPQGDDDQEKSLSSFQTKDSASKTLSIFKEKNYLAYILIGCMTLPFLVIIALLFLRVFAMFFEIIF